MSNRTVTGGRVLKHYVEFYFPGLIFSETSSRQVERRDVDPDVPQSAYAWRFYDQEEIEQGGETLKGKPKNYSPTSYIGKELTPEEAIATDPGNSTLRGNIEGNGYKRLVKTRHGRIFPLEDGARVVRR